MTPSVVEQTACQDSPLRGEPASARQLDKAPYDANEDLGPEEMDKGWEEPPRELEQCVRML